MATRDLIPFKPIYKKDKLVQLFTTHEYADCVFVCGKERIPAHKLILACSSPVFESMFYGQMAESEITLPDINSEDLKKMLEYLYTDQVVIMSVTSAWALIYVCLKYFLTGLLDICVDYVKKHLNMSNLVISYEYAMLYNQQELITVCRQDIIKYTKGLLHNNDYHMKRATLRFILDQCVINASESDLIMLAVKWAMEECTLKETEATQENIRQILLDNVPLEQLNFSKFDGNQYELTEHVLNCDSYYDISCLSRFVHILNCYHGKDSKSNGTCRTIPNHIRYKYRNCYRISKNFIFFDTFQVNSIISSSRTIYLFGIAVTTLRRPEKASNNLYVGSVEIKLTCNTHTYLKHKDVGVNLKYDDVHFINFPVPMRIEWGNLYGIFITYEVEHLRDRGEVLLYYLEQRYTDKTKDTLIDFSDELEGSVVRAVCFYPA